MEPMEFQVDSCVLVVATYAKKLLLNFGKDYLLKENLVTVDCYALTVKKDFSNHVPLGFENSYRSDPACYVAKYSKHKHYTKNLTGTQNLTR